MATEVATPTLAELLAQQSALAEQSAKLQQMLADAKQAQYVADATDAIGKLQSALADATEMGLADVLADTEAKRVLADACRFASTMLGGAPVSSPAKAPHAAPNAGSKWQSIVAAYIDEQPMGTWVDNSTLIVEVATRGGRADVAADRPNFGSVGASIAKCAKRIAETVRGNDGRTYYRKRVA